METTTLRHWRLLARMAYGEKSRAVAFFDRKIKESPKGEDEPVLTDDSQMMVLLRSLGR